MFTSGLFLMSSFAQKCVQLSLQICAALDSFSMPVFIQTNCYDNVINFMRNPKQHLVVYMAAVI